MKGVIGVVGLGIMGGAIARNLTKAGWEVVGFDIVAERRSEAEAAWQSARRHLLPSQESSRSGGIEPARTFAESLRDRLSHAAPELFDLPSGHEHSRDVNPSRRR